MSSFVGRRRVGAGGAEGRRREVSSFVIMYKPGSTYCTKSVLAQY